MPDIIVDPADIVHSQGGLLIVDSTTGSGTGNYDSFLRVQANGDEAGYNTDVSQQLDNKDGIWTHSLLISSLSTVTYNGETYYEIRLDLNEVQSGDKANISLDDLKLYVGPAAGGGAYPAFSGLTLKFDLSGAVALQDNENGSGTDDYQILIPTSMLTGGTHLTLYSDFSDSDDGFEEFRAQTTEFTPQPDIGVNKQTNGTDDECPVILVGETVTWTYTVENNGNLALSNVVLKDDNGTLDTADDFYPTAVLVGGYNIGDTNQDNILDLTETWQYSHSGAAVAGEYMNIATVSGDWASGETSGTVNGVEEDCYYGATPSIAIQKLTNGTNDTCPVILVGETVTWTYNITNTGDIALSNIIVSDDNGTPGNTGDDFFANPVLSGGYNIGDINQDNLLDLTEEWQFTYSGTAIADEYTNIATVTGDATDDFQNVQTANANEEDCYYGAAPAISIVKLTNGTDDLCPVVTVGSTVTWTYNITNTGNVGLTNIIVSDDNGTPGNTADDFFANPVLAGAYNIGDVNTDNVLDLTETWQFTATGIAQEGHYDNIATVTGDFTDDFQNSTTVDASENDCYLGVEGPGVRTPGFWQNPNNGGQFWDGIAGNEKNAGQDCFPTGDLLYPVDSTNDDVPDAALGLLIGDYDRDGTNLGADGIANTADDEDVIFISLADAQSLINAKNNQMSDGVVKIGRDVVATWLNYLAGNPIGDVADDGFYSPKEAIDDAIDYLQIFGDSNNAKPGGFVDTNDPFDIYSINHKKIDTSSSYWNQDFPGGDHSGADIHGALDEYNNFGSVDGVGYAHDCDSNQFLTSMTGFSLHGDLIVC